MDTDSDTAVYENFQFDSGVKSPKTQVQSSGSRQKGLVPAVIIVSVLLIISLLAVGVLAYLYNNAVGAHFPRPVQVLNHATAGGEKPGCGCLDKVSGYLLRTETLICSSIGSYVFSVDEMNWMNSRGRCQNLGGDLVIVNSTEEQEFLAGKVSTIQSPSSYWIGLTDELTEGVWLWVDHTHLDDNLSWWHRQPDDWKAHNPFGEDCAVYNAGKWADVSCLGTHRRICEIPCL